MQHTLGNRDPQDSGCLSLDERVRRRQSLNGRALAYTQCYYTLKLGSVKTLDKTVDICYTDMKLNVLLKRLNIAIL
jgi:hypothetical protein